MIMTMKITTTKNQKGEIDMWLVYEWYKQDGLGGLSAEKYTEFDELYEAQEYADKQAKYFDEEGLEFDIRIYQLTNY